jgi:GDPmannose 4,6-dehydratase
VQEVPQTETDAFLSALARMRSAKMYAYWIVVNYREAYGMHASNGILFNHESPRRGETFLTRKVTRAAAAIRLGLPGATVPRQSRRRSATGAMRANMCEGMWRMLQQDVPDDYVLATGVTTHSVRVLRGPRRSAKVGMPIWCGEGEGAEEKGRDRESGKAPASWRSIRVIYRPTEVDLLIGNPAKAQARSLAGVHETKIDWKQL